MPQDENTESVAVVERATADPRDTMTDVELKALTDQADALVVYTSKNIAGTDDFQFLKDELVFHHTAELMAQECGIMPFGDLHSYINAVMGLAFGRVAQHSKEIAAV